MIPGDFQFSRPTGRRLFLLGTLGVAGLLGLVAAALVITFIISAWLGRPVVFGYNQGPTQPIAFPHTVHSGVGVLLDVNGNPRLDDQGVALRGLGLDCTFCHRNVTKGSAAVIPPVNLCMTCHKTVGTGLPGVEKLRAVFEEGRPINWVRVHRLPDHVQFAHEPHIRFFSQRDGLAPSGVCSTCHGDVSSMVQVTQVRPLKMGDCVNCHRDNSAPTDCTACHY